MKYEVKTGKVKPVNYTDAGYMLLSGEIQGWG